MKQLLVNADDFGLTEGVSRGVVTAMEHGIVRSASAMVCAPGADRSIRRYAPAIAGRIGLHLQLTSGVPILLPREIPTLVGPDGRFPSKRDSVGPANADEILSEWRAQAERLQSLGVAITHIDSHHHIHRRADVFPVFAQLALELGVPARSTSLEVRQGLRRRGIKTPDIFINGWFGRDLSPESLAQAVAQAFKQYDQALAELMCHPGEADEALSALSGYTTDRARELRALTAPETALRLADMGVELVGIAAVSR